MHSKLFLVIFCIQVFVCFAKPVKHANEFADDQLIAEADVLHSEHAQACDEIMGTSTGTSEMERETMDFLLNGHMHNLNILFQKLLEAKCYPPSTIMRFRSELVDLHEFLISDKEHSDLLDSFSFKDALKFHDKNKRNPSQEYFKELNDMVTSLIETTDTNDPNSVELLRYMLEYVAQLEKDGDLNAHQAIKLLSRINDKLA